MVEGEVIMAMASFLTRRARGLGGAQEGGLAGNRPSTDARATTLKVGSQMKHAPTLPPACAAKPGPPPGALVRAHSSKAVAAEPTAMDVRPDAGMRFAQFAG
jgi:hypothetical protein